MNNDLSLFLPQICEQLVQADPDILAIVQFGSSIYAPESARDLDLLIFTRDRKAYGVYDDATLDFPLPIDPVPHSIDRPLGGYLAASVAAWGKLLYGERYTVERMIEKMPVPTYDEARQEVSIADDYFQLAQHESHDFRREAHYRTAFNTLFDCARLAAMAYLNTDQTRWGELRRQLPEPYREQFRQTINHLHIGFFYDRALPTPVEAEYQKWRDVVFQFIDNLEKLATQATDS